MVCDFDWNFTLHIKENSKYQEIQLRTEMRQNDVGEKSEYEHHAQDKFQNDSDAIGIFS